MNNTVTFIVSRYKLARDIIKSLRMNLLWICDSWSAINNPKESTLRLIQEANDLGHNNFFCDALTIHNYNSRMYLNIQFVSNIHVRNGILNFSFDVVKRDQLSSFDYIFFRCDPPFSLSYINRLQLLQTEINRGPAIVRMINTPSVLLTINSKIICAHFEKYTPCTLISSDKEMIYNFCIDKDRVIIKPLNQGGSKDVEILACKRNRSFNTSEPIIKKATSNFTSPIVVQEYIDPAEHREIRIWFSRGEIIAVGGKRKVTNGRVFNSDKGDYIETHELTVEERKAAGEINIFLKKESIDIAAVDLIDAMIVDFNISSPGLLCELEEAYKENFAKEVLLHILI
jgi:glutathione synthase